MRATKTLIAIVIMLILISGLIYYMYSPEVVTKMHSILNTKDQDWNIVAINNSMSGKSILLTSEELQRVKKKLFEAKLYKRRFSTPQFDPKDTVYRLVLNNSTESFSVTIDKKGNIAILFRGKKTMLNIDKKSIDYIFNILSK